MSEAGEIVGMVDVLKLTYATLDQVWSSNILHNMELISVDQQHQYYRQRRSGVEQVLVIPGRWHRVNDVW